MNAAAKGRRAAPGLVEWTSGRLGGPALICVPWAGAGAAPFRFWASACADDINLYGVRLPGRESRAAETPLSDMTRIVDQLADDVAELSHPHVALFGHCSGALVAYELAHRLGPLVVQLSVASQLPPAAAAEAAGEELSSRDGLAARYLNRELLDDRDIVELLLPVLEADMRAVSGYRHRAGRLHEVPITVFRGSADTEIGPEQVTGWWEATSGPLRVREMPGADHLFTGAAWRRLGDQVAEEVRRAARHHDGRPTEIHASPGRGVLAEERG